MSLDQIYIAISDSVNTLMMAQNFKEAKTCDNTLQIDLHKTKLVE